MLAAVAPISLDGQGNWFDGIVAILLLIGLFHGRKRGMSGELLPLFQWLTVLVVCSLYYDQGAALFLKLTGPLTTLYADVFVYVVMMICIILAFTAIKRLVGEKLVGSDLFGRSERYLGMLAGMVRYFCYVLVFLALLNAPVYTQKEIDDAIKSQTASVGSVFFPPVGRIQQMIMKESLTGHLVKEHYFESLLIRPTSTTPGPRKPTLKERKAKELDRAISP